MSEAVKIANLKQVLSQKESEFFFNFWGSILNAICNEGNWLSYSVAEVYILIMTISSFVVIYSPDSFSKIVCNHTHGE